LSLKAPENVVPVGGRNELRNIKEYDARHCTNYPRYPFLRHVVCAKGQEQSAKQACLRTTDQARTTISAAATGPTNDSAWQASVSFAACRESKRTSWPTGALCFESA
jgi:hypothetical protein